MEAQVSRSEVYDDNASEVASRLAMRMNELLDQIAPSTSRRRARIDIAVRRELEGGADPVDILEALELEIEMRKKRKASEKSAGAEAARPKLEQSCPVGVRISANNLSRLNRIQEAEEDQVTHLPEIKKAAADEAFREEEEFQARIERGSVVMQNILKDLDNEDFDDPQDAIQPWDSISNVLPPPSVIAQMQRAQQQRAQAAGRGRQFEPAEL